MTTTKQREEFRLRLMKEFHDRKPEEIRKLARLLMMHGATHGRLMEEACNRELTPREKAKEHQTETLIRHHCERIVPVFSGDPRGATVKLKMPSGYYDDWGQTGLCVPTS